MVEKLLEIEMLIKFLCQIFLVISYDKSKYTLCQQS